MMIMFCQLIRRYAKYGIDTRYKEQLQLFCKPANLTFSKWLTLTLDITKQMTDFCIGQMSTEKDLVP